MIRGIYLAHFLHDSYAQGNCGRLWQQNMYFGVMHHAQIGVKDLHTVILKKKEGGDDYFLLSVQQTLCTAM